MDKFWLKKFILIYNLGELIIWRCKLNLLEIIYLLCLVIVLICFVYIDSYLEMGCKKSFEWIKENIYSICI